MLTWVASAICASVDLSSLFSRTRLWFSCTSCATRLNIACASADPKLLFVVGAGESAAGGRPRLLPLGLNDLLRRRRLGAIVPASYHQWFAGPRIRTVY